ncbi:MAG: hypothetical protein WCC66_01620 [Rhizobiaceae bacterium]
MNVPPHLIEIAAFPGFVSVEARLGPVVRDRDYVHWFSTSRAELETNLAHVSARLKADGMLWISWPKKASKVPTDITEDVLRTLFLPVMLVDVKVCAIDEIWSGLKFMWRREHRVNVI